MHAEEFLKRVAMCLAKLHVAYPRLPCSKVAALVWSEVLDGMDIEDVEQACREYLRGESRTPTPADIRSRASEIAYDRRKSANAVRVGGVTYLTLPPQPIEHSRESVARAVEAVKAQREVASRRQRVPTADEQREFEARRQEQIARLRAFANQQGGASHE